MPARNDRAMTSRCLRSLYYSTQSISAQVRFLLIDDASPAEDRLPELFTTFRGQVASTVEAVRFETHQHYTGVFNYALSHAVSGPMFFVSNDMVLTPSFLTTVLAASALSADIGVVRGTSAFVSGHPEHRLEPLQPLQDQEQIFAYSRYVQELRGLATSDDVLLSGDAVLITPACRDKVGHFDPRFRAYFSDVDYGLRVQQAGLRLVCAKGAWLHHDGAGHLKAQARTQKLPAAQTFDERYSQVQSDYLRFREKWDPTLPETFAAENLCCRTLLERAPTAQEHGEYRPDPSLVVL